MITISHQFRRGQHKTSFDISKQLDASNILRHFNKILCDLSHYASILTLFFCLLPSKIPLPLIPDLFRSFSDASMHLYKHKRVRPSVRPAFFQWADYGRKWLAKRSKCHNLVVKSSKLSLIVPKCPKMSLNVSKCPKMSQNVHFRRIVVRTDFFPVKKTAFRTDGPTDGRTDPLIEMRRRI